MDRATAPVSPLQPRDVYTDPRSDAVWRHGGAWWSPLVRRPHIAAIGLGLTMLVVTFAVAQAEDLPIRDADGILGGRAALLLGTLLVFFALEILPRAIRRRSTGVAFAPAVRQVVAERWNRRRLRVVLLGLVAFYATYLSYRNLKSYLPFIVDQNHDAALLNFDRGLTGGHDPAMWLQSLLGTGLVAHVLSSAYLFYLAFVPISLGAALILSSNPVPGMWWVTALSLNWMLGAATYYLLPAVGPAFFEPSVVSGLPETGVTALQDSLVLHRAQVLADPFATAEVQSIAAFASLHVSVVFSAALMAHLVRVPRGLRLALWGFFGLTMLATVYFGWHYVVDDLAGLVIGALAVALSAALTGHWRLVLRGGRG
jgi:membrane-associated phospholipid phosphatase